MGSADRSRRHLSAVSIRARRHAELEQPVLFTALVREWLQRVRQAQVS